MKHSFAAIPAVSVPRSIFDRSHDIKTTFDSGYLVPFLVEEVLPGDTFTVDSTLFTRMTTPITPVMDNVYLETFYFFVPNRLVWDNFQRFMGERIDPNDPNETTEFLVPQVSAPSAGWEVGSLADYFGIPVGVPNLPVSALPFRAYNLIYNEWFRDENLQSPLTVSRSDGPDLPTLYELKKRGKRHDYFTSCLPWPQKGDPVGFNIGGDVPVYGLNGVGLGMISNSISGNPAANSLLGRSYNSQYADGLDDFMFYSADPSSADPLLAGYVNVASKESGKPSNLYADLSETTAITVNALRQAFAFQRLLEKDARGGTRYTEIIRSQFGVVSPDARLQRPEYLGGDHARIHFNAVQQTSGTTDTSPQGNLAAFALGSSSARGFSRSFVEHGFIIGLMNIRCDLSYQKALNKMWSRRTRMDFYWPTLAHLGEQAVLNREIYAQGTDEDEKVFGFQERWAEYRYKPSLITGKMRSGISESLDIWHLAQNFESLPVLNSDFIEENPPIKRILAVQNQPEFLLDGYIKIQAARPMPVYSVPGLIDHL